MEDTELVVVVKCTGRELGWGTVAELIESTERELERIINLVRMDFEAGEQ